MTYPQIPPRRGDSEPDRTLHGLLRFVREAAARQVALPGEIELTARLGCTRQQLRNAMAALEAQGIVRRRQGTVTTVDPIALRLSVRLEEQFEHLELLGRLGFDADVEVLDTRQRAIAPAIAALLELELAMSSLVVRKRWRADGRVAMVADDTVPLPPDAQPADTDESVFSAVARLWGEPVVWEVCTPGVALVDGGLAGLFEKPVGAPLLTLEIVGIGASGRRLLHSTEYHDPDVVQYSMVRTVRPPWATR